MAWRPHGRASVNPASPRAFGICDRCGFWSNLCTFTWQHQWAGNMLQNLRILVCSQCLDVPQQQLRSIILPADPQPVFNSRPEFFDAAQNDYRVTKDGGFRVTQDGASRTPEQNGDIVLSDIEVPL